MTWCAVRVHGPPAARDAMAAWLVGHTGHAVQEDDDGSLVGFAADEAAGRGVLDGFRREFGGEGSAEIFPIPPVDWSVRWRDGLVPRRIGRLTITTSWAAGGSADPVVIIDPESAFGSGEHGSTRTALALLERHLRPGSRVLDLGSGSGILAIAAVRLGAARATGIESDAEAVPVAERNAARNGVGSAVTFLHGDAGVLAPLLGPVELVLSNILRSANVTLLPAITESLAAGGLAVFAGMEAVEREIFLAELAPARLEPVDEALDEGWWGVAARRR